MPLKNRFFHFRFNNNWQTAKYSQHLQGLSGYQTIREFSTHTGMATHARNDLLPFIALVAG